MRSQKKENQRLHKKGNASAKRSKKRMQQRVGGYIKRLDKPAECLHCDAIGALVKGDVVYPNRPDLVAKDFYKCPQCEDSIVGCHQGTTAPLGKMANKETRYWRMKAHEQFDRHWKNNGISRDTAYLILAKLMGLTFKECHIGMFTVEQCKRVVELADVGGLPNS